VKVTIAPEESRQRLDRVLAARFPKHSRAYLQKLIRDGRVELLSGGAAPLRAGRSMTEGEEIEIRFPPPSPSPLVPEAIPLSILHEDASLIVLNKPPGLVVHPGSGARTGTLVHALLHHCRDLSGIGGVERPGIVHRLDKDTSGVLVVAKDDLTHRALVDQFRSRTITKVYRALVWGAPRRDTGEIDVPIGRDSRQRVKISPRTDRPREAFTVYRVLERLGPVSWLEVRPRTGRTHQIRVHLDLLGHPIVGDRVYGAGRRREVPDGPARAALAGCRRLSLHALSIAFVHPRTGRAVAFEAPLPDDLLALLAALRG